MLSLSKHGEGFVSNLPRVGMVVGSHMVSG
jgi:hypothetical protein